MSTQKELIDSEEFENALIEGAEYKKDIDVSYKAQNKSNYQTFYEIMLNANEDIKRILDIKKSKRNDADNERLESFKKDVRAMYSQVQMLTIDEHLEEGKKTRIEKIVDKIIPVIDMLRYIGNTKLDDEFKKYGVVLTKTSKLEDKYLGLNDENKCKTLVDIFTSATNIKQKVVDGNEFINSDIFTKKVPIDLQYDKGNNNTGIKPSDFKKLVDVKTKLILANSEEAKEKIEEKIEHIASEKQFEAARAELVRDKLMKLS